MPSEDSRECVTIHHSNEADDVVSDDTDNVVMIPAHFPVLPVAGSGSYVTNVIVSSMCTCCTGQQARRCSVNVGEWKISISELFNSS